MRMLVLMLLLASASWAQDTIKLERTRCLGMCPAYTIEIRGDGTVVYEGTVYVAVQGERTSSISKERVQDLFRKFEEAGFFEMKEDRRYIADAPSVILEVNAGTRRHKLQDDRLEETELKRLAKLVDEVVGTDQWVRR